MSGRDIVQLTCKEVVEMITDYQLDAMETAARVTFEQHLFGCTWCMTYLKQVERTVELTAQLQRPQETPPSDSQELPQKLAALFRTRKPTK
jgi:hypothetical protein